MSQAISFWALEVPAGEGPTPMISDIPRHSTTVRITMAAIDPTASPIKPDEPLRATLKIMRRAPDADDYDMSDDDEDEENDEDEDEEESEDEAPKGKNGKKLSKKEADAAVKKALKIAQENAEKMEVGAEDEDDEEDEELEDGDFEVEEFVLCTLDPKNHYQQTLDLTIDEDDEVFFKVIGNFDVSLSGNYMVPAHDHGPEQGGEYSDSEEEDSDFDLSPDEDELYGAGSDDDLDDVPNPRIVEVDSEEEAPKKADKKKNLKRAAEEPKEESKPEEKKLSKKQLKKLKANDGKAVDATAETPDKKSVKFAEKLEQGPTGSAEKPKAEKPKAEKKEKKEEKPKSTSTVVQGVVIEDKKIGTGALAKNGARLGMRYIGKLQNGKTFDSNTKGKPFSFRLGRGEVIKGWDIGLAGMRIGGERRLTIPPNMAYGKQANAGIPANSTLIFDVKLLEVK